MWARRFLGCIFVLTLLVVAVGFAIYQWGGRALVRQAVPRGHFQAPAVAAGIDYSLAENWVARPDIDTNPAQWRPRELADDAPGSAAIFYIHPTTYLKTDAWNAPLKNSGDTDFRTNLFVQSQASAFNGAGQVWAPRYRQAAYGAFLLKSEDALEALNSAYRDVAAAFDDFLKKAGDRPIILAGHSQGALHLERLLREKVAGKPIARRIVAAYVVGWPISTKSDLPALGLPPCTSEQQAGCILSWMTFAEPANPDLIFNEWVKTKGLTGGPRRAGDVLCVNPISGTEDGAGPAANNAGTLMPNADLSSASLQPKLVGARCSGGLLILQGMPPPLGPFVLPGNNYHVYDYALFWGSIRADAQRRLAAWHP